MSLIVTDSVGQSDTAIYSVSITNCGGPVANFTWSGTCLGNTTTFTDGSSGGSPPYTYNWDFGDSTTSILQNPIHLFGGTGTYTVSLIVTDSVGQSDTAIYSVSIDGPIASISASTNVSCNGGSDGSAIVSVSGGTIPYTYNWSPSGATNDTVLGLSAGTNIVTVTDASGCTAQDSVIIIEPTVLTATATSIDANCGNADGTATVTAAGGTTPYTYQWDSLAGGQTTATAIGLLAGTYTVTVTDANGCIANASATVNGPASITLVTSGTNAGCNSVCDGIAAVAVSGGISPYTYLWDDPGAQTTDTAISLCAGTYMITVTDATSCSATANVVITNSGGDPFISGSVSINGTPVTAGLVALFTYNSNPTMMTVAATTNIDFSGNFTFIGVPADDYLVIAEADTSIYPNTVATYYDSTNHWQMATIVTANCSDSISNIDISVIDFPTNIGFGDISGRLFHGGPGKTGAFAGVPIPEVKASLELITTEIIKGATITDDSGSFQFTNIPDGQYSIYIDIPGLAMDSTYYLTITASAGDTVYNNLDFYVDTTPGSGGIYIDTTISIGIANQYSKINSLLMAYPNPFSDFLNIEYTLREKSYVILEMYDILGKKIQTLYRGEKTAGKYKYTFNLKEAGSSSQMHFVKLILNNNIQIQRIIEVE